MKKYENFIAALGVCGLYGCSGGAASGTTFDDGGGESAGLMESGTESSGTETTGVDTSDGSETGEAMDEPEPPPGCGNGELEPGELCDDGNDLDDDSCTSLCMPPSCHDGIRSGDETAPDCGGSCDACDIGSVCASGEDCTSLNCSAGECAYASSCADLLAADDALVDGVYPIDPDGVGGEPAFDVYCDMTTDGGGWTLVMTSSDDGVSTWTFENRAYMTTDTTTFGSIEQLNRDFKSPAYNRVDFEGLMFRHEPSGMWAVYGAVAAGNMNLGAFIAGQDAPLCGENYAGGGYTLTAGNLIQGGGLCDTDLYFNLGDHDGWPPCDAYVANGAFGPGWNANNNDGCPFDDPAMTSLGPLAPCVEPCLLNPDYPTDGALDRLEGNGRGFARTLELNTGAAGAAENYMQIFVR